MADSGEKKSTGENQGELMKILIKSVQEKDTIEINRNALVKELKELVSKRFKVDIGVLCLIFAGKILKDEDSLESHKIKDGLTVHLVIRAKKPENSQTNANDSQNLQQSSQTMSSTATTNTSSNESTNTTTPSTNPPATDNPFSSFGIPNDFNDFQQQTMRQMMNNPDSFRQIMNNPLFNDILSNPDYIRQIMEINPQTRAIMEQHPQIMHILSNPEVIRGAMEMTRSPAAMQELMRTQDIALRNLEATPGGYNQLRRMYTDFQEPLMNATQEQLIGNPFAPLVNNSNNSSSENTQSGVEVRDPLPNPWAPASNDNTNQTGTGTGANIGVGGGNTTSTGNLGGGPNSNNLMNMFNNQAMQSMMRQVLSNPELYQQMLSSNPFFSNNPSLANAARNPALMENLMSPEFRNAMSNPEVLDTLMQINRNFANLQRLAPDLFNRMMQNQFGFNTPGSAATGTPTSAPTTGTTPTTGQPAGQPRVAPPEERYRAQLEQLASMGFTDRSANVRALAETFGDVNAAIERLLSRP